MEREDEKKPGSATPMAVATVLTMLGLSVGVNVQELFAESPQGQIESKQDKISPGARQGKTESVQGKQDLDSRQNKGVIIQNKPAGSLQQKEAPAPKGQLPAVQNKASGMVK